MVGMEPVCGFREIPTETSDQFASHRALKIFGPDTMLGAGAASDGGVNPAAGNGGDWPNRLSSGPDS